VAHPTGVDGIVFARLVPVDSSLARPDGDIAAGRAARADASGFLEKPDPHLEPEILRRQRADGTDIDGVQGVIIVELPARVGREGAVAAAIHDAKRVVSRDVPREPDAPRGENAAL